MPAMPGGRWCLTHRVVSYRLKSRFLASLEKKKRKSWQRKDLVFSQTAKFGWRSRVAAGRSPWRPHVPASTQADLCVPNPSSPGTKGWTKKAPSPARMML